MTRPKALILITALSASLATLVCSALAALAAVVLAALASPTRQVSIDMSAILPQPSYPPDQYTQLYQYSMSGTTAIQDIRLPGGNVRVTCAMASQTASLYAVISGAGDAESTKICHLDSMTNDRQSDLVVFGDTTHTIRVMSDGPWAITVEYKP